MIEMSPNLIEIMAPYRFMMESWSGIGSSTIFELNVWGWRSKIETDDDVNKNKWKKILYE